MSSTFDHKIKAEVKTEMIDEIISHILALIVAIIRTWRIISMFLSNLNLALAEVLSFHDDEQIFDGYLSIKHLYSWKL